MGQCVSKSGFSRKFREEDCTLFMNAIFAERELEVKEIKWLDAFANANAELGFPGPGNALELVKKYQEKRYQKRYKEEI